MGKGKALPGGTDPRRIQLRVESVAPDLSGIDKAIGKIFELNQQLIGANTLAGTLNRKIGVSFAGIGASAEQAAAQSTRAMDRIALSVRGVSGRIAAENKNLISQSKQYNSVTEYAAGKPASTRTVLRSGLGVKQTVLDVTNGGKFITEQWKPSEADKWWNQAVKLGDQQLQRDLKAQRLWREHDVIWAKRRAEEAQRLAQNQENLGAAARRGSLTGATSRTSIEQQAALAMQDFKLNATKSERQLLAQRLWRQHNRRWGGIRAEHLSAQRQAQLEKIMADFGNDLAKTPRISSSSQAHALRNEIISKYHGYITKLSELEKQTGLSAQQQRAITRLIRGAERRIIEQQTAMGSPQRGGLRGLVDSFRGDQGRWLNRGLSAFTPSGFARNFLTVSGWTAAVGALYSGINSARYSYGRMEDLQLQTARLQQVFRGTDGNAKELADDVLKLSAVEGRGSEEAIKASIAWSRLGLSRRQVAEATRVSLMAANVAEMTADQATQHLAAVMATYHIQVSELDSVLGMLNQTSNTYRVTNNDLLTGLSRVSSVASQAGMSLGELQGVLAAAVQKTGQSGSEIANALQMILVRLNRPDVRTFFGQRFGLTTTGRAEDLRKIWVLYQQVNQEQQRDILLRAGGARQANRLRAILDSYPEAMRASIVAMRNLNSAERENILVTNTLAASRTRLSATWDRFVNSPRIARGFADWMDVGSGVIAGMTPNRTKGAKPQQWFFNPDKAHWLAGSAAAVLHAGSWTVQHFTNAFGQYGPFGRWLQNSPFVRYVGLANNWNYRLMREQLGYSQNPTTSQDLFQKHMQTVYNLRYKAGALGEKQDWMRTLAQSWGTLDAKQRAGILDALQGVMSRVGISELRNANPAQAGAIFTREAREAHQRQLDYLAAATRETKGRLKKLDAMKEKPADYAQERQELFQQSLDLSQKLSESISTWSQKEQDAVAGLEKYKDLLNEIGSAAQGFGLEKFAQESTGLRQQIILLQSAISSGNLPDEASKELGNDLRSARAKLSFSTTYGPAFDSLNRRRTVVQSVTNAEADARAVGSSRGEQLLHQREWLQEQIAHYQHQLNFSEDDAIRYGTLLNSLKNTELELTKRTLEVDKERRMVLLETTREFQKTLIGAGPSELLGKLAALQVARRGIKNAGQLFSLSPQLRRDVYQLNGGEQMAALNVERHALSGRTLTAPGLEEKFTRIEGASGRAASVLTDAAGKIASSMGNAAAYARMIEHSMGRAASHTSGSKLVAPSASRPPQMFSPWETVKPAATEQEWMRVNHFHGNV